VGCQLFLQFCYICLPFLRAPEFKQFHSGVGAPSAPVCCEFVPRQAACQWRFLFIFFVGFGRAPILRYVAPCCKQSGYELGPCRSPRISRRSIFHRLSRLIGCALHLSQRYANVRFARVSNLLERISACCCRAACMQCLKNRNWRTLKNQAPPIVGFRKNRLNSVKFGRNPFD
jgi:hypothetical protein